MTSFFCFIHDNQQIDDCTDQFKVGYQENAVAFIRRETRLGKDYFKLTYRFGYVELLAVDGFFGSLDFVFSLLRSSIPELPVSITNTFETISTKSIFISAEQKKYVCKNRILNQDMKTKASRLQTR